MFQARTGDKTAFVVLFDRHGPVAGALVSRLLDRPEDIADVLQEAAAQALVCLDRLQSPARFGPWLCGIALNLARQQLRARAAALVGLPLWSGCRRPKTSWSKRKRQPRCGRP